MNELVNVNIPAPSDPALAGAAGILAAADNFVVCDQESYEMAGNEVRRIAGVVKRLEDLRLSITRPIDDAKRRVMDLFRIPMENYGGARDAIQNKMRAHRQEEERKAREREDEQRRLAAEEQRRVQEEAIKRAQEAEAQGDHESAQAALEEASAPPPLPPVVTTPRPKAAGTSWVPRWNYELQDLDKVIAAAHAGDKLARACLGLNEKVTGSQVRALKDQFKVPGIRVWDSESMSARAR